MWLMNACFFQAKIKDEIITPDWDFVLSTSSPSITIITLDFHIQSGYLRLKLSSTNSLEVLRIFQNEKVQLAPSVVTIIIIQTRLFLPKWLQGNCTRLFYKMLVFIILKSDELLQVLIFKTVHED